MGFGCVLLCWEQLGGQASPCIAVEIDPICAFFCSLLCYHQNKCLPSPPKQEVAYNAIKK